MDKPNRYLFAFIRKFLTAILIEKYDFEKFLLAYCYHQNSYVFLSWWRWNI